MFPEERKQRICELVNEKRSVKVAELSRLMGISEVTIRRDLEELSRQKHLIRTHGGAIAMYSVGSEISATELIVSHKNIEEKRRIAALAYAMINDGDTVIADGSSTVHELMKLVAAGDKKNLLVITNSFSTISMLEESKSIKVIMLGGEVNVRHNYVEGHLTVEAVKNLRADKCFIGINGIDETFGYSTPRFLEAELKGQMLRSSLQSYILADKSKFGNIYLARIMGVECDCLITDAQKNDYDYGWLEERTAVLFANSKEEVPPWNA